MPKTPPPKPTPLLPALALLLAAACADRPAVGDPAAQALRQEAERSACAAAELLERATENVAAFDVAGLPGGMDAARRFALAYRQHAELRATVYTQVDSAVNLARTPADSARHMALADGVSILTPQPGTLEANVIGSYTRDLDRIRIDPDHRCNW